MTPPILAERDQPAFRLGTRGKVAGPPPATQPAPTEPGATEPTAPTSPTEVPAQVASPSSMLLLRRATWGPTRASLAEITSLGTRAWLEQQLNPAGLADPDGDAITALYPELRYSPTQARATLTSFSGDLLYGMVGHTIGRAVWSRRQLHEVMTAFWANHLHIQGVFWDSWDSRHRYDLDVIRKHALGDFRAMLQAAVRHPAMLRYLDQNNSRVGRINENLGRELLELHTVGVGNHTEADVKASAAILTGLSLDSNGEFLYRTAYHQTGALTILKQSFANASADGQAELTRYLDFLARHPKTAERLARKLVTRFVSDDPPAALISRLATIYLSNDTAIAPVLRALFTSPEFAASAGRKLRTPQEDLYAQIRAMEIGVARTKDELLGLNWALGSTGHAPMDWATPDGFPDDPAHFATPAVALGRMNRHMETAGNWWPKLSGYPVDATGTASLRSLAPTPLPPTHGELVQALANRLLFTSLDDTALNAVLGYLGVTATAPLTEKSAAVTWRLGYVVALLFDSAIHAIR